VIAGAFLTQNTGWGNVERALANLRRAGALSPAGIRRLTLAELERLVRPSGYFRQKAQRLKTFVTFLDAAYGGSLARMLSQPTELLRRQLLALNGVGPETADSILLYAGNHPVFVVDAYTRRLLERHQVLPAAPPQHAQKRRVPGTLADYEETRALFERALQQESAVRGFASSALAWAAPAGPRRVISEPLSGAAHFPSPVSLAKRSERAQVYNEMHALIVGVGKNYCLKGEPKCAQCPLGASGFRFRGGALFP
jgi:endonuclease III-like uncharacterized protein